MITAVVLVLIAAALLFGSGWLSCSIARKLEARFPPRGLFVSANGVRMHLLDLPAAQPSDRTLPTVLLVHGANLCSEDMRMALGERLSRKLRVIIPDRPGQGYSAPGLGPLASPAYQVTLIREVLRERGVSGPLIVVGHSFGGLIALRYALDNPDTVKGLVVINPTTHPRPHGIRWIQRVFDVLMKPSINYTVLPPMFMAMMGRVATRIFRPEPPPPDYAERSRLGLALMAKRFSGSLQEYSGLRDQLTDHVPRYPAVRVPTVIVAGSADPVVPPQIHAEALAQAIPGARLVRIAGAGHMAHHAHAEVIAAEIERLAGCAGGQTTLRAVERPLQAAAAPQRA
ncbi:Alpha/beta hydrolase [Rhodopseudomonas palustris HaA2]|uniref:Alpha/beta hydrolase n=1 Tax=Rhodopseudomonas palustris (strain HaA2) TaxID=316058 RepID=Q2IT83_RHOP2|nr:alpha/beta hydrolase [Rhodopseudomonas palustris]ABD08577.1 Alpha/beta hydrolase [Rhodopseudomonas palustris HaA2]